MNIPDKYLAGLTPYQRVLQARLIRQSQRAYEATGEVLERPKVSKKTTPRSPHAKRFENRYGFPVTDTKRVKAMFPDTDVEGILAKGLAAYASSGSRPNVSSYAWAKARLASVLTGGKAYGIDKDLVGPKSREKIF